MTFDAPSGHNHVPGRDASFIALGELRPRREAAGHRSGRSARRVAGTVPPAAPACSLTRQCRCDHGIRESAGRTTVPPARQRSGLSGAACLEALLLRGRFGHPGQLLLRPHEPLEMGLEHEPEILALELGEHPCRNPEPRPPHRARPTSRSDEDASPAANPSATLGAGVGQGPDAEKELVVDPRRRGRRRRPRPHRVEPLLGGPVDRGRTATPRRPGRPRGSRVRPAASNCRYTPSCRNRPRLPAATGSASQLCTRSSPRRRDRPALVRVVAYSTSKAIGTDSQLCRHGPRRALRPRTG